MTGLREAATKDFIEKVVLNLGTKHLSWPKGMKDTPDRVIRMWDELLQGYDQKPEEILSTTFEGEGYDQMVVINGVFFHSICEHHLLPFHGIAHVGYIVDKRVVGLSKLARLVDCYARRLQIQERMTTEIAEAIVKYLKPIGVGVVLEATHLCMVARGVQKPGAVMRTCALKGKFLSNIEVKEEFFSMCGM